MLKHLKLFTWLLITNQKDSMESDLDPCRNHPAPIGSLVFKVLAQVPYDTSRFIKSFGVSFPLVQKQRILHTGLREIYQSKTGTKLYAPSHLSLVVSSERPSEG